jgi:hypothetical protein
MLHVDAGCDPNGWCWPAFDLHRPVIERQLDAEGIAKVCGDGNFACTLDKSGPVCQIIMPKHLSYAAVADGWNRAILKDHELAHCAGFGHEERGRV